MRLISSPNHNAEPEASPPDTNAHRREQMFLWTSGLVGFPSATLYLR